jgi:porphobilinogen synthase
MIKLAAQKEIIDYKRAVIEATTAIRRAGADILITYFARDFGKWAQENSL